MDCEQGHYSKFGLVESSTLSSLSYIKTSQHAYSLSILENSLSTYCIVIASIILHKAS